MNPPVSWWWAAFAGLVTVSTLPFVGQSIREDARPRCRWDGRVIDALFRVSRGSAMLAVLDRGLADTCRLYRQSR